MDRIPRSSGETVYFDLATMFRQVGALALPEAEPAGVGSTYMITKGPGLRQSLPGLSRDSAPW